MDDQQLSDLDKDIREALQHNDPGLAAEKLKKHLEEEDKIPLNIGITGETGSGKSTFVNAFRGVDDMDEGAAPTGCDETTMEVTAYPHPNYPNVTLWDLPGIGTTNFPADEYLKLVGFEKFDFFIIISDTRFRENDVKLAKEIQRMGKKFYFVRSKIDNDVRAEKRKLKESYDEGKTLAQIRKSCVEGLQKQGISSPQVFLVSHADLHLYDFQQLQDTLERELPAHKRHVLLFAMPNVSQEVINKKKKAFQDKIKYLALLSAAVAGVPVPGLSVAVDVSLMIVAVTQYLVGFGLDVHSLQRMSRKTGVPYGEFLAVLLSPLAKESLTSALIVKLLAQSLSIAVLLAAEEGSRFIPFLGIPAAMGLSFLTTYRGLSMFLDVLADDAQRVFKKVMP